MKTTLELPDELMRAVKLRAVREDRKLKDTIAELLQRGLSQPAATRAGRRQRVKLPLVRCARRARAGQEMTPGRVAGILIAEEAEAARGALR
jgi:hypothetical protein